MKKFTAAAAMIIAVIMVAVSFYGCIKSPYEAEEETSEQKIEIETEKTV